MQRKSQELEKSDINGYCQVSFTIFERTKKLFFRFSEAYSFNPASSRFVSLTRRCIETLLTNFK